MTSISKETAYKYSLEQYASNKKDEFLRIQTETLKTNLSKSFSKMSTKDLLQMIYDLAYYHTRGDYYPSEVILIASPVLKLLTTKNLEAKMSHTWNYKHFRLVNRKDVQNNSSVIQVVLSSHIFTAKLPQELPHSLHTNLNLGSLLYPIYSQNDNNSKIVLDNKDTYFVNAGNMHTYARINMLNDLVGRGIKLGLVNTHPISIKQYTSNKSYSIPFVCSYNFLTLAKRVITTELPEDLSYNDLTNLDVIKSLFKDIYSDPLFHPESKLSGFHEDVVDENWIKRDWYKGIFEEKYQRKDLDADNDQEDED